jgi:hypothetical protein
VKSARQSRPRGRGPVGSPTVPRIAGNPGAQSAGRVSAQVEPVGSVSADLERAGGRVLLGVSGRRGQRPRPGRAAVRSRTGGRARLGRRAAVASQVEARDLVALTSNTGYDALDASCRSVRPALRCTVDGGSATTGDQVDRWCRGGHHVEPAYGIEVRFWPVSIHEVHAFLKDSRAR